jgi:hypothetical protein
MHMKPGRPRTSKHDQLHPTRIQQDEARSDSGGRQSLSKVAIFELYLNEKFTESEDIEELKQQINEGKTIRVER